MASNEDQEQVDYEEIDREDSANQSSGDWNKTGGRDHDNDAAINDSGGFRKRPKRVINEQGLVENVLFLSRFSPQTTTDEIRKLLEQFGETDQININGKIAFVDFMRPEDAAKAKYALHHGQGLGSESLIVDFKKNPGGPAAKTHPRDRDGERDRDYDYDRRDDRDRERERPVRDSAYERRDYRDDRDIRDERPVREFGRDRPNRVLPNDVTVDFHRAPPMDRDRERDYRGGDRDSRGPPPRYDEPLRGGYARPPERRSEPAEYRNGPPPASYERDLRDDLRDRRPAPMYAPRAAPATRSRSRDRIQSLPPAHTEIRDRDRDLPIISSKLPRERDYSSDYRAPLVGYREAPLPRGPLDDRDRRPLPRPAPVDDSRAYYNDRVPPRR